MPKTSNLLTNKRLAKLSIATGVIIFGVSGWAWWTRVYTSPTRVFWGMIDTSLSTASVTMHLSQATDSMSVERSTQLRLGSQNASHMVQTRKQTDGRNSSTVVQETVGTPDTDYLRFPYVVTGQVGANGQPVDYASIEGVWGKTGGDGLKSQKAAVLGFNQAVLGTVPFANLPAVKRNVFVHYIRDNHVYSFDAAKAVKNRVGGKQVYEYSVSVGAKQYFTMLQEFAATLGIGPVSGLDPSQYDDAPPLGVHFTVDIISRQLIKIHYNDSSQDETFDSYGVRTPIAVPDKTTPLTDLEKRIQSL